MKRIVRNASVWLLVSLFVYGRISWRGDYDAAHREALKTGKYLVVLLVDPAAKETSRVVRRLTRVDGRDVVAVLISKGISSYPIEMYYTTRFPALFVVDGREVFVCKPMYGDAVTPDALRRCLYRIKGEAS